MHGIELERNPERSPGLKGWLVVEHGRIRNTFLIGMMGSWKTTAGSRLARRLQRPFLDLDEEIEQRSGRCVTDIFHARGEPYFRKLESEALRAACANSGQVIGTGGGIILAAVNRRLLKENGLCILLEADPGVLARRIRRHQKRPLLPDERRIESDLKHLWETRKDLYYETADIILNTDALTPEQVGQNLFEIVSGR